MRKREKGHIGTGSFEERGVSAKGGEGGRLQEPPQSEAKNIEIEFSV